MAADAAQHASPFKAPHAGGGRLRHEGVSDNDRNYSLAVHLSPLAATFFPLLVFAPIIMWLLKKDESVFIDDHGREATNALISFLLWHIVLIVSIIGIMLIPVLWIVAIVNLIRASVAASAGEYFRYPITIRFID